VNNWLANNLLGTKDEIAYGNQVKDSSILHNLQT
jgi:hypothetical protein